MVVAWVAVAFGLWMLFTWKPPSPDPTATLRLCSTPEDSMPTEVVTIHLGDDVSICGTADENVHNNAYAAVVWLTPSGAQIDMVAPTWIERVADGVSFRASTEHPVDFVVGDYVVKLVVGREIVKTMAFRITP